MITELLAATGGDRLLCVVVVVWLLVAEIVPDPEFHAAGWMFWFIRNRFVVSYRFLIAARRG
jgi:hypothetical protein